MRIRLMDLLKNKFRIPENLLDGSHDHDPLTGVPFHFSGIDLTYLFMEVEKLLGRKIDANKVLHYEFNTIAGIVKLMEET